MKKAKEYAIKINEAISDMIDKENLMEEMSDADNLKSFIHALANIHPTVFYNYMTGDKKNNMEFNHLANHLLFQYMKK